MIRSYIIANVLVGVLNSVILTLLFWIFGIKYFYFIGAISGFASLIPYLGVSLSLLPPLAGRIEVLHKAGPLIVLVAVVGLHLVGMNLIYPRSLARV
jgi:predicted PurR-regulated permease PerM